MTLKRIFGHNRMNDEIRTILVRSRDGIDVGSESRDSVTVSQVVECQGDSSVSRSDSCWECVLQVPMTVNS